MYHRSCRLLTLLGASSLSRRTERTTFLKTRKRHLFSLNCPRVKNFRGQRLTFSILSTEQASSTKSKLVETPKDDQTVLVIQPEYKSGIAEQPYVPAEFKLEEAVSLAEAVTGWEVASRRVDTIRRPHNKFLFGKGKIKELKTVVSQSPEISGVFINIPTLTPLQHRSLEELFNKDVFDRFSIILKIFKERAKTREAKVQVALAEVPYLRSRLVEEEAGFDQQRGGTGKVGGGGETTLEVSQRKLHRQEKALKQELKEIRMKHRVASVHRVKHSLPVVAVVGYTNAGKTSLIKALSKDESMHPEDMLFATLDTTMHAAKMPCGLKVLLVDTIGFISDLPHELVESFASTLEDVTNADLIVHVRDASHPQSHAQRANVLKVLHQLNLKPELLDNMIEVLNKTDKVDTSTFQHLASREKDGAILISATEGAGLDNLLLSVEKEVMRATNHKFWRIVIPTDGPQLSWLHHEATVCSVDGGVEQLQVMVVLSEAALGKLRAKFGDTVSLTEIDRV